MSWDREIWGKGYVNGHVIHSCALCLSKVYVLDTTLLRSKVWIESLLKVWNTYQENVHSKRDKNSMYI